MSTKIRLRSQLFVNEYTLKNSNGRDFLVVPGVPVREQVMNTYYVPAEEIEFAEVWNGTPITIRHPKQNNGSANVPEPDVAIIGRFYNSVWDEDGKHVNGEYWIDISEAMQYVEGQYIVNSIYANQVLETSTGYYASEEFTEGEFNGRPYLTIQHNLKPDHIAILVDEVGACSVADGCGVNRNSLLHSLYTNVSVINGGPGSGFWGHLGRPGQVGGAAGTGTSPKLKTKTGKRLKKGIKAYYVAGKDEATKKSSSGFKTKTSLMSKAKAAALFNSMTKSGSEPAILEVDLKKGTVYESLSANSITVQKIPGSSITIITFDTLQKRTQETFTNAAECDCDDAKKIVDNEESISQKIDKLRKAFYEHSSNDSPYSYYIADYYEDYLVVEGNNQLWKCTYTENNGEYTFQDVDDWTKLVINPEKYVEANAENKSRGGYLVVEKGGEKHLPTKKNGKYDHGLCGAAWAALHGGYRGQKYQGPNKQEAIAKLKNIYKTMGWTLPTASNAQNNLGKQMKSTNTVKGVKTIGTRKVNKPSLWTVTNSRKEKTMKVKIADILKKLRGEGVVINTEEAEVDEEMVLDLSDEEGEDDEEDEQEQVIQQKNTVQLTQNDLDIVRKLGKVNWETIGKLAEQAPVLLEVTQNAVAERDNKKKQLIVQIKANSENPFSDDELNGFSLPVLTKLNNQYNTDYSGLAAGYTFSGNVQGGDDDEVLEVQSVILNTEDE